MGNVQGSVGVQGVGRQVYVQEDTFKRMETYMKKKNVWSPLSHRAPALYAGRTVLPSSCAARLEARSMTYPPGDEVMKAGR